MEKLCKNCENAEEKDYSPNYATEECKRCLTNGHMLGFTPKKELIKARKSKAFKTLMWILIYIFKFLFSVCAVSFCGSLLFGSVTGSILFTALSFFCYCLQELCSKSIEEEDI